MNYTYTKIEKVKYHDGNITHLLMVEDTESIETGKNRDMAIDLLHDCTFNPELTVTEVLQVTPVENICDVFQYCAENRIPLYDEGLIERDLCFKES